MTAAVDDAHIGLVVEGKGEVEALPLLLRTYLYSRNIWQDVLGPVICCNGRAKATRPGGIEKLVATSASRPGCVGVLVLLDSETDLVCVRGPELQGRVGTAGLGKPVRLTLVEQKFEAWIVASAETMPIELSWDPERDPVAAIREALGDRKYIKPVWQPRLTECIDLSVALPRSLTLQRLIRVFDELLESARLPS